MEHDSNESRRSQAAGSVKEVIGKLVGDKRIEDEGAREKTGRSGSRSLGVVTPPDPDKPD